MDVWKWLLISEAKCINIQYDFLRSSLDDYSQSPLLPSAALQVAREVLIFQDIPPHRSNDIHGVCACIGVCVCALLHARSFGECLTFSRRASITQRLCHTSPIQLIAGQRLLAGRHGPLLDLCVIKYLFEKISQSLL